MQLQHFIKEKLEKNEFKAALANEELVFFTFLFGAKILEVPKLREEGSSKIPLQCARVIRMVRDGYFGFKDYFQSLCDTVDGGKDFYLLGSDFESYLEAQDAVDKAFADPNKGYLAATEQSKTTRRRLGELNREDSLPLASSPSPSPSPSSTP
ncbi:unnamed protein product [Prunus armeniaca]